MKFFNLFILLFVGSFPVIFAQENCERSSCTWDFFELKETIEGTIICHEYGTCGHRAKTSITILKIENDTFRVLSSCDDRSYSVGEKIYVTKGEKINQPSFMQWVLGRPIKKKKGWKKDYKKAQAQLPSRFDQLVLKTTFGNLSDKSDCERSPFKAIHHNSFQCDWTFFEIEKPLEGKIIQYQAKMQPCHLMAHASLAIIAIHDNQDTIRVLDYCNTSILEKGAKVIIKAGKHKSPVSIPYTKTVEGVEEIYRSNEFDEVIFRTTYGEIINKQ